jgi:2-dehydro-3-deoxyphosphogluconate aldolase/(4S)-4-hydroxy-2-oxoglutarate aldolase
MEPSSQAHVLSEIRRIRIVPVIVIGEPANAVQLADALRDAGLPCAEITFRTRAGAESLRRIASERPDVLVGAGTILTRAQAAEARAAGARFVVSPGFDRGVVEYCLEHDVPVFPGVCTPTEVTAALACGLRVLKFFPAEAAGGLPFLEAIAAPFPDAEFIPTGGINAGNVVNYLRSKSVAACGGSWMAPRAWVDAGDFERVRREAAQAAALAHMTHAGVPA